MIRKINKLIMVSVVLLLIVPGMVFGTGLIQKEDQNNEEVKIVVDKVNDEVNQVTLSIGQKPNAGYVIHIVRIDFIDEDAVITYHLTTPEEGEIYAEVMTEPKAITFLASGYKPVLQNAGSLIPSHPGNGLNDRHSDQAGIRGTIKQVVEGLEIISQHTGKQQNPDAPISSNDASKTVSNGKISGIYIEAEADSGYAYDKAYVRLQSTTKIYKQKEDQLLPASKEELKTGIEVEVTYDGPIAESYPIQTRAGRIIILESK